MSFFEDIDPVVEVCSNLMNCRASEADVTSVVQHASRIVSSFSPPAATLEWRMTKTRGENVKNRAVILLNCHHKARRSTAPNVAVNRFGMFPALNQMNLRRERGPPPVRSIVSPHAARSEDQVLTRRFPPSLGLRDSLPLREPLLRQVTFLSGRLLE